MGKNAKTQQFIQKYSIFIVLIVMFLACSALSPYFLKANNMINIMRQICVGLLIVQCVLRSKCRGACIYCDTWYAADCPRYCTLLLRRF